MQYDNDQVELSGVATQSFLVLALSDDVFSLMNYNYSPAERMKK